MQLNKKPAKQTKLEWNPLIFCKCYAAEIKITVYTPTNG